VIRTDPKTNLDALVESVRRIDDVSVRAVRAQALARSIEEARGDVSAIRRECVASLRAAGWKYRAVAELLGLSISAVEKLAERRTPATRWWERVPEDVRISAIRGPGGRRSAEIAQVNEVAAVVLSVLRRRRGAIVRPAELRRAVVERTGKPASTQTIAHALARLVAAGKVEHPSWGAYRSVPAEARSQPATTAGRSSTTPNERSQS